MTSTARYLVYGRVIESDLALPLPPAGEGSVDLSIVTSEDTSRLATRPLDPTAPTVVASRLSEEGQEPWYVVTREPDGFLLRIRTVGEFQIAPDLRTVTFVAEPDGESRHLAPVLAAGTLQAVLLLLGGELVLHASAVAVGRDAVAFVGPSGRGKSTTAALCAAAGGTIVSDDVLLVDVRSGQVRCRGSGGELRLRDRARGLAELFPVDANSGETVDARLSLTLPDRQDGWVDLRAVVVPYPDRQHAEVESSVVPAMDALFGLMGFPRIDGLVDSIIVNEQFALHSELVRHVPVHQARVPWGPPWSREVGADLLRILERPDEPLDPGQPLRDEVETPSER